MAEELSTHVGERRDTLARSPPAPQQSLLPTPMRIRAHETPFWLFALRTCALVVMPSALQMGSEAALGGSDLKGPPPVLAAPMAERAKGTEISLPDEPFWMPSDAEIDMAREELLRTLDSLNEQLSELPIGVSIASELELEKLAECVTPSDGNVAVLEKILRRSQRTRELPESPSLKPLRSELSRYVTLMRIRALPDAVGTFRRKMVELADALRRFDDTASRAAVADIADSYSWLALHSQAPQTRELIADRFARPNIRLEAGEELLRLAETMTIDRDLDIDQTFQGIRTTGNGAAHGTVNLRYVPNNRSAQLRVTFHGSADCSVSSRRRRVTVLGKMNAEVAGQQDFLVTTSIESRADVEMDVQCDYCPRAAKVALRCGAASELVGRLAMRVARNKTPEVERISAREVRKQVAREVGQIVDEQLSRANHVIDEQFLGPLDAADIRPQVTSRTSESSLAMTGTIAAAGQLAASQLPSHQEDVRAAARLKVHESLANNVSVLCEGLRLDPADYRSTLGDMFGMELKLDGSDRPLILMQMVQFAAHRPVDVRFRDGLVLVTLRFEAFSDGVKTYEGGPWQARTAYRLSIVGSQIAIQRAGPVEIVAEESMAGPLAGVVAGILFQQAATSEFAAVGQSIHRLKLQFSSVQVGDEWISVELRRQGDSPIAEQPVVSNVLGEGR